MRRNEVLNRLKGQHKELTEQFGIVSLFLFGSMARDEASPNSDVDLMVEFKYPIGLFQFIELQQKLEALLECKVDLGTRRSLKSQLKDEVLREAILVV